MNHLHSSDDQAPVNGFDPNPGQVSSTEVATDPVSSPSTEVAAAQAMSDLDPAPEDQGRVDSQTADSTDAEQAERTNRNRNRRANVVLFLSVMVENISNTLIIPLLPFYAQRFDASPLQTTLVFSMSAMMGFLFAPIWGSLSDQFGRRPTLLISIAGSSIACFCFGLVDSLPALFACNALAGIAAGSFTISSAYIGDATAQEKRAQRMGVLNAAFAIGSCLGPILGGVLVGSRANPDYFLPAIAAASVGAFAFLCALFGLPESRRIVMSATRAAKKPFFDPQIVQQLFTSPLSRTLLLALFLTVFAVSGVQATIGLWAKQVMEWGPQQVSFIYAFWGLTAIFVEVALIGILVRTLGEANLFALGLLVYSAGLSLIPVVGGYAADQVIYLTPVILLACLGFATCRSVFASLLSQSAPARNQGKVMGIAASSTALAGMIAPPFAGYTFSHWGPSWPFWIGPTLILTAIALSWPTLAQSHVAVRNVKQRLQNLKVLFSMLDYDQNGLIEATDFEKSIEDIAQFRQWDPDSIEFRTARSFWIGLGKTLQEVVDEDQDGKVSLDELTDYVGKELDIDFANAFARLIDRNDDGQIVLDELKQFYQLYRQDIGQLEESFEGLDLDKDGSISLLELQQTFEHFMYAETVELRRSWLMGI